MKGPGEKKKREGGFEGGRGEEKIEERSKGVEKKGLGEGRETSQLNPRTYPSPKTPSFPGSSQK